VSAIAETSTVSGRPREPAVVRSRAALGGGLARVQTLAQGLRLGAAEQRDLGPVLKQEPARARIAVREQRP
jgi:hypothetical protein